jgi:ribosomal protein S18 acetylase RimI-like enzyme
MIEVVKLNSIGANELENILEQIKNIFFLSTSIKEFSSPERKEAFFKRWCGDFIEHYPESFYLMIEDSKLLGYLSGCLDSEKARAIVEVPGYAVFQDVFSEYPAHLHINFHPDCRGRGLGSTLVNSFINDLKVLQIRGVHLVTSPDALNISFYKRLGFTHEIAREFNAMSLLFMGKKLD